MPFIKIEKKLEAKSDRRIRPDGDWINYRRNNKKYTKIDISKRNTIIDIEGVSLSYDSKSVISNLSFQIKEGDYLCIVGENGSGKSTLIDAILGLKKVDSGKISYLDGMKRSDVGFLPQKTEVQCDFPATVKEIVLSGCIGNGGLFFHRRDKRAAFENMEKLGIAYIADSSFRELSGGQQQRALLSRALCAAKRMLVLDEPVTGLDPRATLDMYTLISDINKREGLSVVMITHDMEAAKKYSSHILYLGKNKYFYGTVDEFQKFLENKSGSAIYGEQNYRYKGDKA